jgi:hypothetical protein
LPEKTLDDFVQKWRRWCSMETPRIRSRWRKTDALLDERAEKVTMLSGESELMVGTSMGRYQVGG